MAFKPAKINDKLTGSPRDVINKVRQMASTNYKKMVPYATEDADSLRKIGAILYDYPLLLNEFANTLYNQVAFSWFSSNLFWKNPWSFAMKGNLERGEIVQEIYVGLANVYRFNPKKAEWHWQKREKPNVKTAFHVVNCKFYYKTTITRDIIVNAFNSWMDADRFIQEQIGNMILSAEYDQFHVLLYLTLISVHDGIIPVISVPKADTKETQEKLIATLRGLSGDFTMMLPHYTISGEKSAAPVSRQRIIFTTFFEGELSVNVLANAFNITHAEYIGKRSLAPRWIDLDVERLDMMFGYLTYNDQTDEWEETPQNAEEGYHHFTKEELAGFDDFYGIFCDEDAYQGYTRLSRSTFSPLNGEGLFENEWYHSHYYVGFSPFKNIVALVGAEPLVTSVIVTPAAATLTVGAKMPLNVVVTTQNFASKAVDWTSRDEEVAVVDASGMVTALKEGIVDIVAVSAVDHRVSASSQITVVAN